MTDADESYSIAAGVRLKAPAGPVPINAPHSSHHAPGRCSAPGGESIRQEGTLIATSKKNRIHQLIIQRLAQDLAVFSVAAKTAHEAAIHEENKPDNKYDTLSLEASYVAQGQANRAQEIKRALHAYQTLTLQQFTTEGAIRLTALVTLEAEDGTVRTIFIGPQEGGMKLQLDGEEVMVITAGSPLGNDLIGKCAGDEVQIGKTRYEIVGVS